MGVLAIGVIIGLVFGLAFGILIVLAKENLKIRNKKGFFCVNPKTGEADLVWAPLKDGKPVFKHQKSEYHPVLKDRAAYSHRSRPLLFFDVIRKEVFDPAPGELVEPWPNAEDRALAYKSIRERNMARAPHNDQTEWAKYGAILGGVSVFITFIILILAWRTFGGFV